MLDFEKIFDLSDSLQDIFLQRVEMFSSTTKSKKIEVKGGFYSESDMKTELGYSVMPSCMYRLVQCFTKFLYRKKSISTDTCMHVY